MRFASFQSSGRKGLALIDGAHAYGLYAGDARYPGDLSTILRDGGHGALARAAECLSGGSEIDLDRINFLPPVDGMSKVICLEINYPEHAKETGNKPPKHPTIFVRFASSLVGHNEPLVRPRVSEQFDNEGELVAAIGKGGRHIRKDEALDHVAGYSIFNDASVRDYQFETPQWTVGKNFDGTGAFGPIVVTADEVPPGGGGLHIETRLNGQVMQAASTAEMIHDVATCVAFLSEAMTLVPGDVLVMGTPPGVGVARKPRVFMKPGDICEVEIEGLGVLRNSIVQET